MLKYHGVGGCVKKKYQNFPNQPPTTKHRSIKYFSHWTMHYSFFKIFDFIYDIKIENDFPYIKLNRLKFNQLEDGKYTAKYIPVCDGYRGDFMNIQIAFDDSERYFIIKMKDGKSRFERIYEIDDTNHSTMAYFLDHCFNIANQMKKRNQKINKKLKVQ